MRLPLPTLGSGGALTSSRPLTSRAERSTPPLRPIPPRFMDLAPADPLDPRNPAQPPSASVTPASSGGSLSSVIAYSWQLQSGRVHGGLPRPSFTANQKDRNIRERSRESSPEAGEQFQPVPLSAGGSIRERDFDEAGHTARRKEPTTSKLLVFR